MKGRRRAGAAARCARPMKMTDHFSQLPVICKPHTARVRGGLVHDAGPARSNGRRTLDPTLGSAQKVTALVVLAASLLAVVRAGARQQEVPRQEVQCADRAQAVNCAEAHPLTRTDVEAFLDGLLPYALRRGDIAGATIAVVKDGNVLFEKGYGFANEAAQTPVDPTTTLFRAGSISKLFTWTAVMQLVQQGKLNLDANVDSYLDFQMPSAWGGAPITLRDLMTHTAGFEDSLKHLFAASGRLMPLSGYVEN